MVLDSCYQFVGEDFLVTIHGPLSPKVPLEGALREASAVAARMTAAGCTPRRRSASPPPSSPQSPARKAQMVADIAGEVGLLEQRVLAEAGGDHPSCQKCQRER
jgi:magnesium transporter